MNVDIKVPEMGESIIEATIARWLKEPGQQVNAGEILVELETDKINLEVAAPQSGLLQAISKPAGANVVVGELLGSITSESTQAASVPAGGKENRAESSGKAGEQAGNAPQSSRSTDTSPLDHAEDVPDPAPQPASTTSATPVAQRMAQDLGVDLRQISPTGAGGRITKEDVQSYHQRAQAPSQAETQAPDPAAAKTTTGQETPAAPQAAAAPVTPAPNGPERRIRMSRRRQTIARRLVEAQHTAAMLTTFNEIDMSAVINLRKRRREKFKEQFGVDLGFMSFFVKACVGALKAYPNINAEIQGDEIVQKQYYDIGIAVGAEEGLVVPVLRGAEALSFAEIENNIRAFVEKTRTNTLSLDDLRGGTFTITNGGVFGSLLSTPILNPPQVAILGMHRIQERPVVVNAEIVARPMMYVALSYDHRIVDGQTAVQFLVRVKELVEDPEALLFA